MSNVALGRYYPCHGGWSFEIFWGLQSSAPRIFQARVRLAKLGQADFLLTSWNNGDGPFALRRRLWKAKNLRVQSGP
jgi:hypothetical protein